MIALSSCLKGEKHFKIMFDKINSMPQLKILSCIYVWSLVQKSAVKMYNKQLWRVVDEKNYNHYMLMVLFHAPQLGFIHYHVTRHELQWRFANLVINKNVFNL